MYFLFVLEMGPQKFITCLPNTPKAPKTLNAGNFIFFNKMKILV